MEKKQVNKSELNKSREPFFANWQDMVLLLTIAGVNLYLFLRTTALAANFTRIYSSAFNPIHSQLVIAVFAINFFILFRNLSNISLFLAKDKENYAEVLGIISKTTVFSLLLFLILSIVPELMLSASYATR
jgi:uncharacterized membrane protein